MVKMISLHKFMFVLLMACAGINAASVERIYSCLGDQALYEQFIGFSDRKVPDSTDPEYHLYNEVLKASTQYSFTHSDVEDEQEIKDGHPKIRAKLVDLFGKAKESGIDAIEIMVPIPYNDGVMFLDNKDMRTPWRTLGESGDVFVRALDEYNKNNPSSKLNLRIRIFLGPTQLIVGSYTPGFHANVGGALGRLGIRYETEDQINADNWDFVTARSHYSARDNNECVTNGVIGMCNILDYGKYQVSNWIAGWSSYLVEYVKGRIGDATNIEAVSIVGDADAQSALYANANEAGKPIVSLTGGVVSVPPPVNYISEVDFLLKRQDALASAWGKVVRVMRSNHPGIEVGLLVPGNQNDSRVSGLIDIGKFIETADPDFIVVPDFYQQDEFKAHGHGFRTASLANRYGKKWITETGNPTFWTRGGIFTRSWVLEDDHFGEADELEYDNSIRTTVKLGGSGYQYAWWPLQIFEKESEFVNLSSWKNVWGPTSNEYIKGAVPYQAGNVAVYVSSIAQNYFQRYHPVPASYEMYERWYTQAADYARPNTRVEFLTDAVIARDPDGFRRFDKIILPEECPLSKASEQVKEDYKRNPDRYIVPSGSIHPDLTSDAPQVFTDENASFTIARDGSWGWTTTVLGVSSLDGKPLQGSIRSGIQSWPISGWWTQISIPNWNQDEVDIVFNTELGRKVQIQKWEQ